MIGTMPKCRFAYLRHERFLAHANELTQSFSHIKLVEMSIEQKMKAVV